MLHILLSLHCLQCLKCFLRRFWISWCGSWWRSAHWHIDMLLHLSVTVLWNWSQKLGTWDVCFRDWDGAPRMFFMTKLSCPRAVTAPNRTEKSASLLLQLKLSRRYV